MKTKLFRFLAVIVCVAIIAGSVFYFRERAEREKAGEPEFPAALGKHIEELSKTIPGVPESREEGPASAAEAEFMARAYPADTI